MNARLAPKTVIFGTVTVVFILLDQLTKYGIRQELALGESREVIPGFFQLVHVENTGAAFGLLAGYEHAMWVFAGFTLVAVWVLISLFRELEPQTRFVPLALGGILSGAVGNAIDRVHKQGVTDFLRFYIDDTELSAWLIQTFGTNEYPSFNVADVAISVGVALFLVSEVQTALRNRGKQEPQVAEAVD